jgi:hypothetical protein
MKRLVNGMVIVAVTALVALGGCQKKTDRTARDYDTFFPADEAERPVWRALEAQAAAGAAADGTLYAHHFTAGELNALGRDKLDLMARADVRPLLVYVATDEDELADARRDSVMKFLQSANYPAEAVQVKAGPNPAGYTPAAPALARMEKTENPGGAANEGTGLRGGNGGRGGNMNFYVGSQGSNGR